MDEIRALGEFGDELLICGGAYGNLEALEALLARARALGIPPGRIIHTGDAAAYAADGAAVAARLAASGVHCLQGNVEQQLAEDGDDCGCGFAEGSSCDALSASWYGHARATVPAELRAWMGQLPLTMSFTLQGKSFLVVHGAVRRINRFMFASHDEARFQRELARTHCQGVIAGHSGLPFTRSLGGRVWHNSGALGLPANDGTPLVWYSVLAPVEYGIMISQLPLDYPYRRAMDKMRQADLAPAYAEALQSGLWPSHDVLPAAERAMAGRALMPRRWLWRHDGALEAH